MPVYNGEKWEIRVQFMASHFATDVEEPNESKLQVLRVWRNSNLIILSYKFPSFIIGIFWFNWLVHSVRLFYDVYGIV